VGPEHFEPLWWRDRGAVVGEAQGRGAALIVRALDGAGSWVLRHYRRGGWVARLTPDRYVWTGLEQTRAWREWRLTARLRELGLPVPEPIAARVIRRGRVYTADLITRLIPEAETLAAILRSRALPAAAWSRLGAMLRRLHEAGVRHDDINVSNILLRADGSFHMIDFDRAAIVAPGAWRERNLARFHRSLEKHRRLAAGNFAFTPADWNALRSGYERAPG
jgi:3-deoxy-D-manno-octulosonic acid kinase